MQQQQQPTINKLCIAALLCLVSSATIAQQGGGAPSEKYGCRNNSPGTMAVEKGAACMPTGRSGDPFVFCTEGMPEHGWISINPLAGRWQAITQYYNPMWTDTFEQICPQVKQMGNWQGNTAPSLTPYSH